MATVNHIANKPEEGETLSSLPGGAATQPPSMLRRIARTMAALGIAQCIHILTQLVLPPVFIARYGVDGFALWLLLTAATSHLNTLDFGLQTYLVNELTLLHHRKQSERFHQVQSVGVCLALMLVGLGVVCALVMVTCPLATWIGVPDTREARWTLGLLSLQVVGSILFGQFLGLYRVLGQPQRGVHWNSVQRGTSLVATACAALYGIPFWAIAAIQTSVMYALLAAVLAALRGAHPEVFPKLDYWNRGDARRILRQSAFFGLFSLNQLLVFQIPVLILNAFCTPAAVVAYSMGRTLYSFTRQLANLVMAAIAPELTRLVGIRDTRALASTYARVQSIICCTSTVGCVGVFLAAPLMLRFWLGKPELFGEGLFLLLMLSSLAMLVKESKLYFQHATNEHIPTALMTSTVYTLMLCVAVPAVRFWGAHGLLFVWMIAELIQILFLNRYNARLVGAVAQSGVAPLIRMALFAGACTAFLWGLGEHLRAGDVWIQTLKAATVLAGVSVASFLLFDLAPLSRELWSRCRGARSMRATAPIPINL